LLKKYCGQGKGESAAGWKALHSLFRADSWDELVALLMEEIAARVAEAVAIQKMTTAAPSSPLKAASNDDLSLENPTNPSYLSSNLSNSMVATAITVVVPRKLPPKLARASRPT
jgi:hypothetical protein